MENLAGVERMLMSGTRATLLLASGTKLTAADVKKALEDEGLTFESFEEHVMTRPAAVYVARTPKFT